MSEKLLNTLNILLVGVGGQGVILASEMLCGLFIEYGLRVKKSEIHGLAQRGGSVSCQVRVGEVIHSPTIPRGQCDYLLAFSIAEGRQFIREVKSEGIVLFLEDEEKSMAANKKTWNMMLLGKFFNHLNKNPTFDIKFAFPKITSYIQKKTPTYLVRDNLKAIEAGWEAFN